MKELTDNTGKKQRGKPFKKGKSGNPLGRPIGSRNKATILAQNMFDDEVEVISRKAIEIALNGDMTAIKFILERVLPPRKDVPIEYDFNIPDINNIEDTTKAFSVVINNIIKGNISIPEAKSIASILDSYRKAIETTELQKKYEELESLIKHGVDQ